MRSKDYNVCNICKIESTSLFRDDEIDKWDCLSCLEKVVRYKDKGYLRVYEIEEVL